MNTMNSCMPGEISLGTLFAGALIGLALLGFFVFLASLGFTFISID